MWRNEVLLLPAYGKETTNCVLKLQIRLSILHFSSSLTKIMKSFEFTGRFRRLIKREKQSKQRKCDATLELKPIMV